MAFQIRFLNSNSTPRPWAPAHTGWGSGYDPSSFFQFKVKTVGTIQHRTMLDGVPNPLFKFKFNIKVVGAGPHRVKGRKRGP
ncbi:hypothetical protein GCM10027094_13060 [Hafnia psychrotolerans]